MSGFIKLSTRVVNSAFIRQIKIENNKYTIYLHNVDIHGFLIYGCGGVGSSNTYIEVCKNKNLSDYTTIHNWINNKI